MAFVQAFEEVELCALVGQRDTIVANIFDQFLDLRVLRIDVHAFVHTRQEARLPVLRFLNRVSVRAHGDERGQVLILAAQAVAQPGTQAGPDLPRFATVHEEQRRLMVWHVGVHRANEADVVDRTRRVAKQVADFDAALPVFAELERRRERGAGRSLGRQRAAGQCFAGIFSRAPAWGRTYPHATARRS